MRLTVAALVVPARGRRLFAGEGCDHSIGYPEKLMPTDYAQRMDDAEIQAPGRD
jgi:hypothetical protein